MKPYQAKDLVDILLAHFPTMRLEEGAYRAYVGAFEELANAEVAFEAVKDIIHGSERWPSIAVIRQTYMLKRDRQLGRAQLEAPDPEPRELPPEVKEWLASHQIGRSIES